MVLQGFGAPTTLSCVLLTRFSLSPCGMAQQVCLQQHEEVLAKLLKFVNDAHTHSWDLRSDDTGDAGIRRTPFRHEIPTAVLVAGQLDGWLKQVQE